MELAPGSARRRRPRGRSQRRLPPAHPRELPAWYKEPHTQPELLAEAVYGLPEFCRDRIPAARLVSNPGCYPTAANLAIRPLVEAGVIDRAAGIVCDAKSGVSGAGRKPSLKTSFCEVTENFSAYSILHHRHVPEVLQVSGLEEREFSFTAQLLPLDRGILETIYFRAPGVASAEDLLAIYERAVRRRTLRPPLQPAARARSARRRPHQFLRYRRHLRCRAPAAPSWSAPSITWSKAPPDRPSRT